MGKRHKLVLIPRDEYKEKVKRDMVEFVEKRWIKGKDTILQDIQNVFQKPPYNLGDGTVRLYLEELVKKHKLSTWRKKGNRFYGPPKLPLSIKVGAISIAVVISMGIIVDLTTSPAFISKYVYFGNSGDINDAHISTLPIVLYSIILILIYTLLWYRTEKKLSGT